MGVSKVEIMENGTARTIMDLTGDTVIPEALAEGYTAHNATGEPIHGEMKTTTVLYTEQNLTIEQKAQARDNIDATGIYVGSGDMPDGYNIQIDPDGGVDAGNMVTREEFNQLQEEIGDLVEPRTDDIPKIFFDESIPQTKDDVVTKFRYISKTMDFKGYAEFKAQGNSSMSYPKKNVTVKMYKDAELTKKLKIDFKGWGEQRKHVYKANWIDLLHARNIVSARIWADVVKSRNTYLELPQELRTSPNQGVVDGFPIKVYSQGIYQGRYTLNIPKDAWMANMNDELDVHCILCGEDYNSGCFRASANINGNDWSDEVHDTVPTIIKTRWNEVIAFVRESTDEEFKLNLHEYFYVDSLIDYFIFGMISCGLDAFGKNQLYFTYDGVKWVAQMYDMDSTWGLYWNGSKFVSASYSRREYEDFVGNRQGNLLYIRLEGLFHEEIRERYEQLKSGVLSIPNIINHFERFTDITPIDLVKEDYANTTGNGKFTNIPSQSTNNIQQIRQFIVDRYAYCDSYIYNIGQNDGHTTNIELSDTTIKALKGDTFVLKATVTPSNSMDELIWTSSNENIATVENGIVFMVSEGNAVITATSGNVSATCDVEVVVPNLLYELPSETTFGSSKFVDTNIKLFDTPKDFTILASVTDATTSSISNIFHCMHEASPYRGLNLSRTSGGTYYSYGGNTSGKAQPFSPKIEDSVGKKFKLACSYKNGLPHKAMYLIDGQSIVVQTANKEDYVQLDETLILGAYQKTDGTKGRWWYGTMHDFKLYDAVLLDNDIEEYLLS